jgi:cytochrome c-type biogenesis protein CcmH/NrfG
MRLRFVVACLSALLSLTASAQAPPKLDRAVASGDKAYTSQNWTEAEPQYSALTKQQPDNARFWYRFGVAARGNKHYDVALEAFQKAKTLGVGRGLPVWLSDYEIATPYA